MGEYFYIGLLFWLQHIFDDFLLFGKVFKEILSKKVFMPLFKNYDMKSIKKKKKNFGTSCSHFVCSNCANLISEVFRNEENFKGSK